MSVRMGISPIGWTNEAIPDLGADIPLKTCLSDAAQAGFTGVELGRKFPQSPAEILAELASFGLSPISAWYSGYLAERGLAAEWPSARGHAEKLIALGCKVLVYGECGGGPVGAEHAPLSERPAALKLEEYSERLTDLADRLRDLGIRLVYHHHMMQPVETSIQIDALMEATGPSVFLLLDTGHLALAKDDYVPVMKRWWHRVGHIHLKDVRHSVLGTLDWCQTSFNAGVRLGMFTVPGDGDLDFRPLVEQIAAKGYDGWVVVEAEQDPAKAPPADMARIGFTCVSALLDKAGIQHERNARYARV